MSKIRIEKINNELQKALSNVINFKMKVDLSNCVISVLEVDTTKDLEFATVYLSIFSPSKTSEEVLNILKNNISFIRREVAHSIRIRSVPKFLLKLDKSLDYSVKINNILDKITIPEEEDDNDVE